MTSYSFTGEWRDGSGLIYLRARYYASGVGRFTTRDTWPGDYNRPLSTNQWAYVEGNPVNRMDPTGQRSCIDFDDFGRCIPEPNLRWLPPLPPAERLSKEQYVTLIAFSETSDGTKGDEIPRATAWLAWNNVTERGGDPFYAIEMHWNGEGDNPISWHQLITPYHILDAYGRKVYSSGDDWRRVHMEQDDESVRRALAHAYHAHTFLGCTLPACANFGKVEGMVNAIKNGADNVSPIGTNNGFYDHPYPIDSDELLQQYLTNMSNEGKDKGLTDYHALLCWKDKDGHSYYRIFYHAVFGSIGPYQFLG